MGKRRLTLLISLSLLLVISACGAKPKSVVKEGTPAPSATQSLAAPSPIAKGTPEMAALIEAAKKEGKIVFYGSSGTPEYRAAITEGFNKKYGITVEYLTISPGEFLTRIDREIKSNQVSVDTFSMGSASNIMSALGQLEDLQGVVIDPEVLNPAVWKKGYPLFVGGNPNDTKLPAGFIARVHTSLNANEQLFINPDIIKKGEIKSWQDLLKPEYKGKIIAHNPRQGGAGQSAAMSIMYVLGEQYFKDLYLGQKVVISADLNQMADMLVRGTYPIAIALTTPVVEEYRKNGLPIERLVPSGGPDSLTGGGGYSIVKGPPHPNAAKLFVNWMLSKEAQETWEKYQRSQSMRTDTTTKSFIVDYTIPRDDIKYHFHDQMPDFHFNHRAPTVKKVLDILGR